MARLVIRVGSKLLGWDATFADNIAVNMSFNIYLGIFVIMCCRSYLPSGSCHHSI